MKRFAVVFALLMLGCAAPTANVEKSKGFIGEKAKDIAVETVKAKTITKAEMPVLVKFENAVKGGHKR